MGTPWVLPPQRLLRRFPSGSRKWSSLTTPSWPWRAPGTWIFGVCLSGYGRLCGGVFTASSYSLGQELFYLAAEGEDPLHIPTSAMLHSMMAIHKANSMIARATKGAALEGELYEVRKASDQDGNGLFSLQDSCGDPDGNGYISAEEQSYVDRPRSTDSGLAQGCRAGGLRAALST